MDDRGTHGPDRETVNKKVIDRDVSETSPALKRARGVKSETLSAAVDNPLVVYNVEDSLQRNAEGGWLEPLRGTVVKREVKKELKKVGTDANEKCVEVGDEDGNTYTQPIVIETVFQLRSQTPLSGTSSCNSSTSSNDKRRFRKNLVRSLVGSGHCTSGGAEGKSGVIRMGDMVRVLPKESERELLVSVFPHAVTLIGSHTTSMCCACSVILYASPIMIS